MSDDLTILKRTSIRWGILNCFCKTLCDARVDLPRSVISNLEVARCIIETHSHEIFEAERLLDDVEMILIKKTNRERVNNINLWIRLLRKTKRDLPDFKEIMSIPRMKMIIQNYEFLSYCIYHEHEEPKKIRYNEKIHAIH